MMMRETVHIVICSVLYHCVGICAYIIINYLYEYTCVGIYVCIQVQSCVCVCVHMLNIYHPIIILCALQMFSQFLSIATLHC